MDIEEDDDIETSMEAEVRCAIFCVVSIVLIRLSVEEQCWSVLCNIQTYAHPNQIEDNA